MYRYIIIGILLALFVTPAIAASYYIAQDAKTKACTVVTQPPDGTTHVQIGYSTFSDHQSAAIAMNATAECANKSEKTGTPKK